MLEILDSLDHMLLTKSTKMGEFSVASLLFSPAVNPLDDFTFTSLMFQDFSMSKKEALETLLEHNRNESITWQLA